MKTHLLLNDAPLLAGARRQPAPDLAAHAHVLLGQALELAAVPVVGALALHEALVALAARVGRLGRKVRVLDLAPVEALHARVHELVVVLRGPGAGAGAVLARRDGRDGGGRGGGGIGRGGVGGCRGDGSWVEGGLRLRLLLGGELLRHGRGGCPRDGVVTRRDGDTLLAVERRGEARSHLSVVRGMPARAAIVFGHFDDEMGRRRRSRRRVFGSRYRA